MEQDNTLTKRQAKRLARTDQLLSTAMSMVGEMGLDAFSMHKLAAAMTLTVGALYRYFPSKGALVAALEMRVISETDGAMRNAVKKIDAQCGDDPRDVHLMARVMATAYAYRARMHAAPEQMRLIGGLMSNPNALLSPSDAESVLKNMVTTLGTVREALDAAVAKGLLREGSSDRRAVLLWAALRGVAEIKKLEQHDKHTFDEAVLFDIALHSLLRGWGGDDELLAKAHDLTLNILGDNA